MQCLLVLPESLPAPEFISKLERPVHAACSSHSIPSWPCLLLAAVCPLLVLSLPWDLHSLRAPSASTCGWVVPSSREDLWQLLMFLDLPRTYLNPTDRPWPSSSLPLSLSLCAVNAGGIFLLKHPTLPLLPVCSLPISLDARWNSDWHSSQATPPPELLLAVRGFFPPADHHPFITSMIISFLRTRRAWEALWASSQVTAV